MYLGLETPNISRSTDKYFRVLLLSAKKVLTRKWLTDIPSVQKLNETVMEMITMSLQLQRDKFDKCWHKLTQYTKTKQVNLFN